MQEKLDRKYKTIEDFSGNTASVLDYLLEEVYKLQERSDKHDNNHNNAMSFIEKGLEEVAFIKSVLKMPVKNSPNPGLEIRIKSLEDALEGLKKMFSI
jgi:hypothetical protein